MSAPRIITQLEELRDQIDDILSQYKKNQYNCLPCWKCGAEAVMVVGKPQPAGGLKWFGVCTKCGNQGMKVGTSYQASRAWNMEAERYAR